jgi:hypothetical protein
MSGYLGLIDLVVVAGAAVVLPVALGRWAGAWLAVAAATAVALSVDPGPVGLVLTLPWAGLAVAATVRAAVALLRSGGARRPTLDGVAGVAAPAFAVVAGVGLVESCGGLGVFGFGEPITRLAAVHFTFAGVATTALARHAVVAAGPSGWRRAATAGLALALVAPPVVGLGFATAHAVPQVGGAVLMAASAYLVSACQLVEAWPRRRTRVGRLLVVSGLSAWVPMVLAVAWALAQYTGGPALSIPDMARVHGSLNAFGFVGCGLAARWLAAHPVPAPSPPADGLGAPGAGAVPA